MPLLQPVNTGKQLSTDHLGLRGVWHPAWLLAAPHRLAFFLAALLLTGSALWWVVMLSAQVVQGPLRLVVPVATAHALLMSLGYMPLFFAGFLFTAGPKWLRHDAVSARTLMPALVTMVMGWVLALSGFHIHAQLTAVGIAGVSIGWTALSLRFAGMVQRSAVQDRVHPALAAVVGLMGVVILWLTAMALALEHHQMLRTTIQLGLWWFVAPMFAIASHRMIAFFDACAVPRLDTWRPMWRLWLILGLFGVEGLGSVIDLWWWPWPPVWRWLLVAFEAPAAALLLWLAVRWSQVQNLNIRMLAMLHGGFVWLGVSLALYAVSHGRMALSDDAASLGLAPLHALTMGYLGITLFAMMTRVSSGYGGRAEPADGIVWVLYWVLQAAVVLRLAAALVSAEITALTLFAIGAWCISMGGWSVRYGHWFGTPRPDGRPG